MSWINGLNSIRTRMTIVMSVSSITLLIIGHLIISHYSNNRLQALFWYITLSLAICFINWLLAQVVMRPMRRLLADKENLAILDASKRLAIPAGDPSETREMRESLNRLLNRLSESFSIQAQFVADASHELRTPLTSIQGYTKLLLRRWPKVDSQLLLEALQTISTESGRLIRLVSDLLQLARSDAGQEVISPRELLDLRTVLLEVEDTVMVIAPDQLHVKFLVPDNPVWIYGDNDALKQVFLNLVNNAIKATPPDGKVTITLALEDTQAAVQVIDTGFGISPENQARVFDRFYRIERSRSKSRLYGAGTGLGLTIALAIVKAHNGTIELKSVVDKGSTFTVHIPTVNKREIEEVEKEMLDYFEDLAAGKPATE